MGFAGELYCWRLLNYDATWSEYERTKPSWVRRQSTGFSSVGSSADGRYLEPTLFIEPRMGRRRSYAHLVSSRSRVGCVYSYRKLIWKRGDDFARVGAPLPQRHGPDRHPRPPTPLAVGTTLSAPGRGQCISYSDEGFLWAAVCSPTIIITGVSAGTHLAEL